MILANQAADLPNGGSVFKAFPARFELSRYGAPYRTTPRTYQRLIGKLVGWLKQHTLPIDELDTLSPR